MIEIHWGGRVFRFASAAEAKAAGFWLEERAPQAAAGGTKPAPADGGER